MKIGRNDPCPCGSGKKSKKCGCGWKDTDAEAEASAPFTATEEESEAALDELDPAKANVMSPEYWDKMSKRLPPDMRKEFGPMIQQVKQYAEVESRMPRIREAGKTLEAHREEYERFHEDSAEYARRADALFSEEAFANMRFSADDVQRAFDAVGYPVIGSSDKKAVAVLQKAIRFLADDAHRRRWAAQLLTLMPDYVAAGRYLDGWILCDSADQLSEAQESAECPFLISMFSRGLEEWEAQRDREQSAMLKDIGLSPEKIRELGYDGTEAWLDEAFSNPEKAAAMNRLMEQHPEIRALYEDQCRATEEAAIGFLRRKEARALLLSPQEAGPWVDVAEKRFHEMPEEARSWLQAGRERDGKEYRQAVLKIVFDVSVEMVRAVFTPARLAALELQLREMRRALPAGAEPRVSAGIQSALMAAQMYASPDDNPFLISLCSTSLLKAAKQEDRAVEEASET